MPEQENTLKVEKQLAYTVKQYNALTKNSFAMLKKAREEKTDKQTLMDIYGLYYNSFAGVVRAGKLCRRDMGMDGCPEIVVEIDGRDYRCKESILSMIFGAQDASQIIVPYDDAYTGKSWTLENPNSVAPLNSAVAQPADVQNIALLQKQNEEYKTKLQSASEEIKKLSSSQPITQDVAKYRAEAEKYKNELQKEHMESSRTIVALKKQIESVKQEHDKETRSLTGQISDLKKYKYDPNYDHYYSDILPKLVDSIEFTHTDLVVRSILIVISVLGIGASCAFLL